ncbi:MAG TPA: DNA-directed RNA polymerase subunit L [Candidatus Nanoarchaeia archaeon]|nr:DNA-directed RNA polymerase subunit L [Candidatus Nanoarchaeia archaeon]
MELTLKEHSDNHAIIEIKGEDHTFCNILRKQLWDNGDIEHAGYTIAHSLTTSPVLHLKAKDPKKALEKASEKLQDTFKELKTLFKSKK